MLEWPLTLCLLVPAWHALPVPLPIGLQPNPAQPSGGPALAMQCGHGMDQSESDAAVPGGRAGVKLGAVGVYLLPQG